MLNMRPDKVPTAPHTRLSHWPDFCQQSLICLYISDETFLGRFMSLLEQLLIHRPTYSPISTSLFDTKN